MKKKNKSWLLIAAAALAYILVEKAKKDAIQQQIDRTILNTQKGDIPARTEVNPYGEKVPAGATVLRNQKGEVIGVYA